MKKKSPPNANTPTQYRSSLSLIVILPVFECSKDLHRRCRLRPLGTPLLLDHGHVSLMYIRVEQIIVFIEFIVRVLFTTQQIWIDTFRKDKVSCLSSFLFSILSTYRSCCFKAVVPPSIHNDSRGASRRWTMRRAMRVSPPRWFRRPCLWVNKRYFRSMYSTNLFYFFL